MVLEKLLTILELFGVVSFLIQDMFQLQKFLMFPFPDRVQLFGLLFLLLDHVLERLLLRGDLKGQGVRGSGSRIRLCGQIFGTGTSVVSCIFYGGGLETVGQVLAHRWQGILGGLWNDGK